MTKSDQERRMDTQAEQVLTLIGEEPLKLVNKDGEHGIMLTTDQYEKLIRKVVEFGFKQAIQTLHDASNEANEAGPNHSLDRWAIFLVGASYLENRISPKMPS